MTIPTVFVRLLANEDKATALASAIESARDAEVPGSAVYEVEPASFHLVPSAPFAYWVSENVRRKFVELPPFEGEGREVRVGLQTSDDFRFVRVWWEVAPERILDGANGPYRDVPAFRAWCRQQTYEGKRWVPFAKGGEYSPFYADIHLVVDWEADGRSLDAFPKAFIRNRDYYFRPGLTWPLRTTSGFGLYALPAGCAFGHKGPAAFVSSVALAASLGVLLSAPYRQFIEVGMPVGDETRSGTASRSYEVGFVQRLPWLQLTQNVQRELGRLTEELIGAVRQPDQLDETCHSFVGSVRLGVKPLRAAFTKAVRERELIQKHAIDNAMAINKIVREILELDAEDAPPKDAPEALRTESIVDSARIRAAYEAPVQNVIQHAIATGGGNREIAVKSFYVSRHLEVLALVLGVSVGRIVELAASMGLTPAGHERDESEKLISFVVGCAFGRWDIRSSIKERLIPKLQDVFDPLPVCSPAMLVGPDGLPARADAISTEAWLSRRTDAITLPREKADRDVTSAEDYPLNVAWHGMLVDDPDHSNDIQRRVHDAFALLWTNDAVAVEQEASELLGVSNLSEYFRRPGLFFADHLKRYSKSRRQAPIYWPLSTASGSYTVWLYYQRMTSDTLFTIINRYVQPKIAEVQHQLREAHDAHSRASGRDASRLLTRIEEFTMFLTELDDFRGELQRITELPYRPNLDDGVIINAAPLHKLFRLPRWAKDTREVWQKLERGDYDWAHMAHTVWPDRVREKCRSDRSLAIAHDVEHLYIGPPASAGKRRSRTATVAIDEDDE
jgi:hypothetical protein